MFYNEALKMMMMTKFFSKDKADAAEQRLLLFCSDFEEKHQKFLIFIKTYQKGKKLTWPRKKEKAKLSFLPVQKYINCNQ